MTGSAPASAKLAHADYPDQEGRWPIYGRTKALAAAGAAWAEAFAGDDWDEGEESIETDVEDGFDDPDEVEDEESEDEGDGE